jgi:hypothetical protein
MKNISRPIILGAFFGMVHLVWAVLYGFKTGGHPPAIFLVDLPVVWLLIMFKMTFGSDIFLSDIVLIAGGTLMYGMVGYWIGRIVFKKQK